MAAPREGMVRALESVSLTGEQLGHGGAALGATESRQTTGDGDATPVRQSEAPQTMPRVIEMPWAAASTSSSEGVNGSVARGRRGRPRRSWMG